MNRELAAIDKVLARERMEVNLKTISPRKILEYLREKGLKNLESDRNERILIFNSDFQYQCDPWTFESSFAQIENYDN